MKSIFQNKEILLRLQKVIKIKIKIYMEGDKEVVEVNIESKKERCGSKYGRSNLLRQEICWRAHTKMLEER